MTVTMDKSGRVVIPKELRKAANLEPEIPFEIRLENGNLVLEPSYPEPKLEYRDGMPVFTLPPGLNAKITNEDVETMIDFVRFGRHEGKY
jgi:AbrB family looped-hinge helix DNA binding protein